MKQQSRRSRTGFTLIEMMVVAAIITLLVAILLPVLSSLRRTGKEAATRNFINTIQVACEGYALEWGEYPQDGFGNLIPATGTTSVAVVKFTCRNAVNVLITVVPATTPAYTFGAASPPSFGTPYKAQSSGALYYFLCTPFRTTITGTSQLKGEVLASKDAGPYLECPIARRSYVATGTNQYSTEIIDIWKNPYQYDNLRDDHTGTFTSVAVTPATNPVSYTITGTEAPYHNVGDNSINKNTPLPIEIRNTGTIVKTPNTTGQNPQTYDIWSYGDGFSTFKPANTTYDSTTLTRPLANFKCVWEK